MVLAIAAVAVGVATTRGPGSSLDPTAYREALVTSLRPLPLNPLFSGGDQAVADVSRLLYRRLLRFDTQGRPVNDLATVSQISRDGLTYRLSLSPGLRWSDGSPITAQDVAATVGLIEAPGFPDAMLASNWAGVAVAADSAQSLTLTLHSPRASFAAILAQLPILPAARIQGRPVADLVRDANRELPDSGPFVVESADSSTIRLRPNPNAAARPRVQEIELRLVANFDDAARALASGRVDGVEARTPPQRTELRAIPNIQIHDTVSYRFAELLFNARRPGLDDPAVRRAIAGALDRGALIRSILKDAARPQTTAIPAGIGWLGLDNAEQPNPDLSDRALDAAGWRRGSDGVRGNGIARLSFTVAVPDAAPLPAVAAQLAGQLRSLGIELNPRAAAADRFAAAVLRPAAFDLALVELDNGPDPGDIVEFWRSSAAPPVGLNVSGLPQDLFLDDALDRLATEVDPRLRADAAQAVALRLAEDAPAAFLYAPLTSLATGPRVHSLSVPQSGDAGERYAAIAQWDVG